MTSEETAAAVASADPVAHRRLADSRVVQLFLGALALLLAGYMFMGRGFAHVGLAPIYVSEIVLLLGLLATAFAIVRFRPRIVITPLLWLLLALMALGAARTIPYLSTYGLDALRDAVLWGYALFALFIYVLIDRDRLLQAMRLYGWVIPVFAIWLPISLKIFSMSSIDPDRLGSDIPLVFFKSPDMTVHAVGAIAFLVLCTSLFKTVRSFVWRPIVAYPLIWAIFIGATVSRGALLAAGAGLALVIIYARRTRNWLPVLAAIAVFSVVLVSPGIVERLGSVLTPSPTPAPQASPAPGASPGPNASPVVSSPPATSPGGRDNTVDQLLENIGSIVGASSDQGLTGTVSFRLAWWRKIVDYTVFGPYFWTGKGFGVNLADDDGFQGNADHSLRAPHNSHLSTLARMGVPGFVLWIVVQASFGIGLLLAALRHRRVGDLKMAAFGAWILVYWTAMMVNTSFDPYLEGPQGGIWFWTLFGLGMVVMRLTPRSRET